LPRRTKYLKMDPQVPEIHKIRLAARIIQRGGVVAFPTETVYGLGANVFNERAVRKIFRAKGRPPDKPLIVHIARFREIWDLVSYLPPKATLLMKRFWPGPLTLVLPRSHLVPDMVTAGQDTVGIRMPSHPVAQALIKVAQVPLAAPSANISGRPSPTTGKHVLKDLAGRIDAVIDAGPAPLGLESTVIDLTSPVPTVLRLGAISPEELEMVLGKVELALGARERRYLPRGQVYVVTGPVSKIPEKIKELIGQFRAQGKRVAVLATQETAPLYLEGPQPHHMEILGSREEPRSIAAQLFQALRRCDSLQMEVILAEGIESRGIGRAIMSRLLNFAGSRVIEA